MMLASGLGWPQSAAAVKHAAGAGDMPPARALHRVGEPPAAGVGAAPSGVPARQLLPRQWMEGAAADWSAMNLSAQSMSRFAVPVRASNDRPAYDVSRLPSLGTEVGMAPIRSRAAEFARRVQREGLPLARLWETKSALLSVGLNAKGKPGIWLVQKIR